MKNKIKKQKILILIAVIGMLLINDVFSNALSLLMDRNFILPKESSIFTFKVKVMNKGSGDWWLYGEDSNFYYYFSGELEAPYIKIGKKIALKCEAFDSLNYVTWCQK